MNSAANIRKYLQRYAEPEIQQLRGSTLPLFKYVLAIPVCNESPAFIERLFTSFKKLLIIVVINQSEQAEKSCSDSNRYLQEWIKKNFEPTWRENSLSFFQAHNNGVLCVDRLTNPIPVEQGVGLARKIACDLALQLMTQNVIQSEWIANTDADATLPANYFEVIDQQPLISPAAALIPDFKHCCDESLLGHATALYEKHLQHYRNGLAYAGSPYAFHSLGSTLVVHKAHYAAVRGFPKRNGGEDFYLLNKLAKTGPITRIPEICIELEARLSERVPFGTGPAVRDIINQLQNNEAYLSYNPLCFEALKQLLGSLPDFFERDAYNELLPELQSALAQLNFNEGLQHGRKHAKNSGQFVKHMHQWLDGFRTLKLIHYLRDAAYPDLPLTSAPNISQALSS